MIWEIQHDEKETLKKLTPPEQQHSESWAQHDWGRKSHQQGLKGSNVHKEWDEKGREIHTRGEHNDSQERKWAPCNSQAFQRAEVVFYFTRGKQSVKMSIAFHPLKSNPLKSHIHLRRCVILMISPFNWPLFFID